MVLCVLLCKPRGFCAGVERAIRIVETALQNFPHPIYVKHEIVHNRHVVDALRKSGAVFVEELSEIPPDSVVIFSAHGVSKEVEEEAQARNLTILDATCPLVMKVHTAVTKFVKKGYHVLLIGHEGHPEVVGTLGQVPLEHISLIRNNDDVALCNFPHDTPLAYVTQTTLSVDETQGIIATLKEKFPNIISSNKEDICYATTNRQNAVKEIAKRCDLLIVVGSQNSSNSQNLRKVALDNGCPSAFLVEDVNAVPWELIHDSMTIGITAGASTPEHPIKEIIHAINQRWIVQLEEIVITEEHLTFK